jgi:hypothetical protein
MIKVFSASNNLYFGKEGYRIGSPFFDLFDRAGLRGALIQLVAFNSRALTEGLQDRLEPGIEFVVGGHLVQKGVVDEPDLAGVVQARHCMIGLRPERRASSRSRAVGSGSGSWWRTSRAASHDIRRKLSNSIRVLTDLCSPERLDSVRMNDGIGRSPAIEADSAVGKTNRCEN